MRNKIKVEGAPVNEEADETIPTVALGSHRALPINLFIFGLIFV